MAQYSISLLSKLRRRASACIVFTALAMTPPKGRPCQPTKQMTRVPGIGVSEVAVEPRNWVIGMKWALSPAVP